jgi:collagenase-like PrtC family protease
MTGKLVLGPVFYHWPAAALRDFYFRIADEADLDTVCVGEVVCSKRMSFFEDDLPVVVERLQRAGKEVVMSSLSLVSDQKEIAAMEALAASAPGLVEANDVSVLRQLRGKPHAIGPLLNIYNEEALAFLVGLGAVRACLNPELPGTLITALARLSTIPLEVLVFGRLPLAISARCFHARAHDRHKDGCQFACGADPDGRLISTIEYVPFLTMNGLQTQSYTCGNLVHEIPEMARAGVQYFRLSPQSGDMVATASVFRDVIAGRTEPEVAVSQLTLLHPEMPFANGFYHSAPGHKFVTPADAPQAVA